MNNWKVIFATVVIFGAGVITGGLLVNHADHSRPRTAHNKPAVTAEVHPAATNAVVRPPENSKLRPPEILSRQFMQQLDEKLGLTSDQRPAIQKIITESQNQVRKVIQDARLEIREALTPEQQRQFDEMVKRQFHKPIYGTNAPLNLPVATNSPATNAP
ncbi:MAG TPA: hypothetical protein VGI63_06480 [Verrucomicrobiae bacterium]